MGRIQQVVLIMLVITTTFKYPDAVCEARMLQPAQKGASPGKAAETGFRVCSGSA
jgi:hypothetical protein